MINLSREIEDFREEQYRNYQLSLSADDEQCAGCGDVHSAENLTSCVIPDLNNGKEADYCPECVKAYRDDIL